MSAAETLPFKAKPIPKEVQNQLFLEARTHSA
jgi:hypothetical protein